ncbi:MAG: glycosyltransferase [Candidatus Altiarchaeota archaeon]
METIAHVRLRYLPLTETFIYNEITSITSYRVLVFCAQKKNLESFPYAGLRSISDLNPISYLINGAYLHFHLGCPHFSQVIEREDVRLLHAHYGPTGLRMLSLKRRHIIPLVTSFRGIDASLFPSRKPGMYDLLFKEGDIFLARSYDMKKDLVRMGCPEGKVMVHHSGINLDEFQYVKRQPSDRTVFLTVARLAENKGVQDAVEAFAQVHESRPNTRLKIVGEGPYRDVIERRAKELRVLDDVDLFGALPHHKVIEEMLKSHIFVLQSFTTPDGEKEGIPNVLMEAAATGMPVVSTRHAGIPELVLEGKTGIVVEERDIKSLGSAMIRLIDNTNLCDKMGVEGRKHVESEFNIKKQAAKLEGIYDELIGD